MTRLAGFLLLLLLAAPAFAQVENNGIDISGGYSLARNDGTNANGWYADAGFRAFRSLYLVGQAEGSYYSYPQTTLGTTFQLRASSYFFGGGPRVFIRKHSIVSPFVEVIVGGAHASATVTPGFFHLLISSLKAASD